MAKLKIDWLDGYMSSSQIVKENPHPGRCGKVKRAPTLSELEGDDTDYYSPDDTHFEDRRR